jgi:type I restriction enzyme S subunit
MRAMKDSRIEFVGEIPLSWNINRNKYLFQSNKELVREEFPQFQLLSLTTKGVIKKDINNPDGKLPESFSTYQSVKKNDIVLCLFDLDVSAVFSGISPYSGMISPAYKIISLSENHNSRYFDYWFRMIGYDRSYLLYSKSLRNTINDDNFREIPTVIPLLSEQKKIANYLDTKVSYIDNIIEKTKESIEQYKKLKLSIITETVTKGLNPDVKMKDSGIEWIGQIPEHWEVLPIKNLFKFNKGLSITKEDLTEDGVSVISYGQIHSKDNKYYKINPALIRFIPYSHPQISQNERVKPGDFIFADTSEDLIGTGNFILNDGMESLYSGYHTILLKPKNENQILSRYLSFLFLSESWRAQIRSQVSGIKLFSLTQKIFKSSMLVIPPAVERELIASYLENRLTRIEKLVLIKEDEVQELEQYKKSLIYEVVTGKKEIDGKEVN